MSEGEPRKEEVPVVMIVERRGQKSRELTSAEVMRILRKRAVKSGRRPPEGT